MLRNEKPLGYNYQRFDPQDFIALYVTAKPKRVVVVRVFIKKTQKTPRKEIKLALSRAKEVQ